MARLPKFYALKVALIKGRNWEYWPMWLVYLPSLFYYIYCSLRARTFLFWSNANPSIFSGGVVHESKWDIFSLIPKNYYPKTILVLENDTWAEVLAKVNYANLNFPLIAKPDIGGRGKGVLKVNTELELELYHNKLKLRYLIQECVSMPQEYSVFYFKNPCKEKGEVTGLTRKELLHIVGDGKSSIMELIEKNPRAYLQLKVLLNRDDIDFEKVLLAGETYVLVPYGNHVRGAMFVDESAMINEKLHQTFNHIASQINGFYFGRFDLICENVEALMEGEIMIVELNGAGAEPAHIYDPNFSFWKAQKELCRHYENMYRAGAENLKKGIPYMGYREFLKAQKAEKMYKNQID